MDLPKSDKRLCSAPDWDWVRYITALVLAAAALLKAWQFAYAPLGTDGPYSAFFSTIVVEFELVFSLALFFGVCPRIMRWATVCLFTVFAAVSFYKAITGEASCGCFGEVKVHPLLTTILDVVIAAASWLSRLKTAESKRSGAWMVGAVKAFAALLVIICSQALLFGGSIIGNGASFDRKDLTFSIARPDDSAEDSLNIAITNNAEEALTISGVKGNCSSGGIIRGVPVTVRPGESASVVYVATDREHQDQRAKQKQRFTLYIGTGQIQKMRVELPLYRKLIDH